MAYAERLDSFFALDPSSVAIVLVDFQADFCAPGALGVDPPVNTHNAATAQRANAVAEAARHLGVRTIYTQQILDLEHLSPRQRRWEESARLCLAGSPGAELFIDPVPGSAVVDKWRFDVWQSEQFTDQLQHWGIDGLVIGGVELQCCVLYAVLGAEERGYHYVVSQDLVSGLDNCDATSNRAVREYLSFVHPCVDDSQLLLERWSQRIDQQTTTRASGDDGGVVVREAETRDAERMAEVRLDAWRTAYRDFIPMEYLKSPEFERGTKRHLADAVTSSRPGVHLWVAEIENEVVGYCVTGPSPDEVSEGAVYDLFVAPRVWRQGLGRRLLTHALDHLRQEGFSEATLWVFEGNEQAAKFYGALGWAADGTVGLDGPTGESPTRRYRRRLV